MAINPDDCDAYNNLERCSKRSSSSAEAAECYQRVIVIQPHRADAHYNLANVLPTLDRHDEAVRYHERAIALKPGFEAHLNLASRCRRSAVLTRRCSSTKRRWRQTRNSSTPSLG